jgi:molybdenum cofactor cytidylyltransferase
LPNLSFPNHSPFVATVDFQREFLSGTGKLRKTNIERAGPGYADPQWVRLREKEKVMPCKVSALILAAGFSSRIQEFKPLMRVGEATMVEWVISLYKKSGVEDVRVVVGHRKDELMPVIEKLDVSVLVNPRYLDGMFSSVLCGLNSLGADCTGCFIHPVDVPLVSQHTVGKLIDSLRATPDNAIRPSFRNRRGHPVVVPSRFFKHITGFEQPGGLRAALRPLQSSTVTVEVDDENILYDVDTSEDYDALLRRI